MLGPPVVPFCPFWFWGSLIIWFWGSLIKPKEKEKGCPYCQGSTGVPSMVKVVSAGILVRSYASLAETKFV